MNPDREEQVNILLVDDKPAKLLTYEVVLEGLGHNLIKVTSAEDALQTLLRTSVAVMVVDVCMPGMDGFDLTKFVQDHPRFRETAIILVSGIQKGMLDRLRGYHVGAVDYIAVPIVPELLRAKVRIFVDLFRKTRKLREMNRDLETLVEQRTRQLRRSNQELEQFAYIASHDLQEPLRVVSSFVQLIKQRYASAIGREGEEFLQYVLDGVQRMHDLVQGLLAYARVDTREAENGAVDCEAALRQTLENLQAALQESAAQVEHGALPKVAGNEVQIVQLLQNVIGNSIKFRRPDTAPFIRVHAIPHGQEWVFSVEDNGIGIDPDHSERIFQMFQRLHAVEEYPGTGIGLAICRKIVERHHGRIWLDAKPRPGCVIHFTLPDVGALAARNAATLDSNLPKRFPVSAATDPVLSSD